MSKHTKKETSDAIATGIIKALLVVGLIVLALWVAFAPPDFLYGILDR